MRFGHLELFVKDPLAAKVFYEEVLGFEVTVVQGEQFVWLKCGEVEILLRPGANDQAANTYQRAASALVLYTDDVARSQRELEGRGLVFRGTDGSATCLTFTDLDGNWFQLANPEA